MDAEFTLEGKYFLLREKVLLEHRLCFFHGASRFRGVLYGTEVVGQSNFVIPFTLPTI